MGILRRGIPLVFILLSLVALGGYLLLPEIVARVVEKVFEEGTGCRVRVENPRIDFLTLKAQIENISIVCKSDKSESNNAPEEEDGFFADRLEIGASLTELAHKRFLLSPLVIEGAYAKSLSAESAFIKTLTFILSKPEKSEGDDSIFEKYFPSLFSGWHFYVPKVDIYGHSDGDRGSLIFGTRDIFARAFEVSFTSEDPIDVPESTVVLKAAASQVQIDGDLLKSLGLSPQRLGRLEFVADAVNGIVTIKKGNFILEDHSTGAVASRSDVTGNIYSRKNELDLLVTSEFRDNSFVELLKPVAADLMGGSIRVNGKISGPLSDLNLISSISIKDVQVTPDSAHGACVPQFLSFDLDYKAQQVSLSDLTISDMLASASLEIKFTGDESFSVKNSGPIEFKLASSMLGNCLGAKTAKAISELGGATFSGSEILPLSFSFDRQPDARMNEARITGSLLLGSENNPLISLKISEDKVGQYAEIESNWPSTKKGSNQGKQGNVLARLRRERNSKELDVESLVIKSLPLDPILTIVRPFFGDIRQYLPPIVSEEYFEINSQGAFLISLENLFPISGSLDAEVIGFIPEFSKADLLGAKLKSNALALSLRSNNSKSVLDLTLPSHVQNEPMLHIDISPRNIEGSYLLKEIGFRHLPFLSKVLKQGSHLVTLSGKISQSAKSLDTTGSLFIESRRGRREGSVIEDSIVEFKLHNGALKLDGAFYDEKLKFSCNPLPDKVGQTNCEMKSENFPIRYFVSASQDNLEHVTISGNGYYRGSFDNILSGEGSIVLEEVATKFPKAGEVDTRQLLSSPINLSIRKQELTLLPVVLTPDIDNPLTVAGTLSLDAGWNISAKGVFPISNLIEQVRAIESLSGLLLVDLSIVGSVDAPELKGRIQLQDIGSTFLLGERVSGAEGISGDLIFQNGGLVLSNIAGDLSEGRVFVSGSLSDILLPDRSGKLELKGSGINLEPAAGLSLLSSFDLDLIFRDSLPPLLQGDVSFEEAYFESELNIETVLRILSSVVLSGFTVRDKSGEPLLASGIQTDIKLDTPSGLYLDASVLQADLTGDFRIQGDLFSPQVTGDILVRDGSYQINQTDFRIISGRATFNNENGSLNPVLALSSEGELKNPSGDTSRIFLTLGGTLQVPKVTLSSGGYASQRELSQQLGMSGGGSQFRLVDSRSARGAKANAGFREIISPGSELSLTDRFIGLTGIDDVRLETTVSARTGDFVPQVVAGRPLPFDLRGILSSELSGDRTNAARLEYRLDPQFSTFFGWRSQSVTNPAATSAANFLFGIRYEDSFKGFLPFFDRIKDE